MDIGKVVSDGYVVIAEGENYIHIQDRQGNNYLYSPERRTKDTVIPETLLPFTVKYTYKDGHIQNNRRT